MSYAELSAVRDRLRPGMPLPFNVRDADCTLLLARGQALESDEHLRTLLARGALVDLSELVPSTEEIRKARRDQLPQLWSQALTQLADVLDDPESPGFTAALDAAGKPVQALIQRDPDLAIFQVLQEGADPDARYGAQRASQSAITALLVAQRLGWAPEQIERAFKIALTMNLSMLALQGELARQRTPPTPAQRELLRTHPERSAVALEKAGIADAAWIGAVRHHHEVEDGSGYPSASPEIGELASLVRRADVYTAKLAVRSGRGPLAADTAGRQMFMQDPGHAITAALVKEFGIYPPGCHVRLASGEIGVVIARGSTITTPVVAAIADDRGRSLPRPLRRDCAVRSYAVTAVIERPMPGVAPPLREILSQLAG